MRKKAKKNYIAWGVLCLALLVSACGSPAATTTPADDAAARESEASAEKTQQEDNQSGWKLGKGTRSASRQTMEFDIGATSAG